MLTKNFTRGTRGGSVHSWLKNSKQAHKEERGKREVLFLCIGGHAHTSELETPEGHNPQKALSRNCALEPFFVHEHAYNSLLSAALFASRARPLCCRADLVLRGY